MKLYSLQTINQRVTTDSKAFVEECEAAYHKALEQVAQHVAEHSMKKPILLLAGPSGAGKTTSALRIEKMLEEKGIHITAISMDNYFYPIPKIKENKNIDLESPQRLDIPLLQSDMEKMFRCEPVTLPVFDFANQARLEGPVFQRKEGEVVVFEGIHALNPDVIGSVREHASSLYVSVRTRVELKNKTLLHPSRIRLIRRLIRDRLFRGRTVPETLNYFNHVQRGERMFIMPFKKYAEYEIDTFIPYEMAVYKRFLADDLKSLHESFEGYSDCLDLLECLEQIEDLPLSAVPSNSLIREFTGESDLKY